MEFLMAVALALGLKFGQSEPKEPVAQISRYDLHRSAPHLGLKPTSCWGWSVGLGTANGCTRREP